ncbi:hypothetical protein HRJ34_15630 [Rhizorhabdus wittichii]|uniref:Uncharacterized protein n=1 Tax=Rhizorhabdus wittichii TaxID=160791 RepID=A0A975D142_9SPHN|nr:hypothetical protein [Rhizorhabdus wittichii]QTH19795.1 hypothetical protein HRJ34_15630 [Rhizorhabdus wittichii]
MREFDPSVFAFDDQDIRVEGQVVSSGPSLSGIEEPIATDGGGVVVAEFTNGDTSEREDTLAWRAFTAAMDGGAAQVLVHFGDPLHQPKGGSMGSASQVAGFVASRSYATPGVEATAVEDVALRATAMMISIRSEMPLVGGEWFSIEHPTWGWRAYNIVEVSGTEITFRPPLREAVTSGTTLEFDDPRCVMRRAQPTSNAISLGRFGAPSISFVEDMRKPA